MGFSQDDSPPPSGLAIGAERQCAPAAVMESVNSSIRRFAFEFLVVNILLVVTGRAVAADDYRSYSYKDFDAITTSGSGYAVSLARDLTRFNAAAAS